MVINFLKFSIVYRTPEYGGVRSPLTPPVTRITWDEVASRALDLNFTALPDDTVLLEWTRPDAMKATVLGLVDILLEREREKERERERERE